VHIWHKAAKKIDSKTPTATHFNTFTENKIQQQCYQPMMVKFLAFEPLEMVDLVFSIIAVACLLPLTTTSLTTVNKN
jgi:hypothetical protein